MNTTPTNALDAFQAAEDKLRNGAFAEALALYLQVVRGVPDHWRSRFRIADTLLNLKAAHHSFNIYSAIGIHAIQSGSPLWGLVAIKMAAAMDRSQADLVHVIAELYCKTSSRLDKNSPPTRRRQLKKTDPVGDLGFLEGDRLIEAAGEEAANTDGLPSFPSKLPPIALFSHLDEDAFAGVLTGLQLKRYVKGQDIIKEGEPGQSFFMLAQGEVLVTRQMNGKTANLARLQHGAVFGEMALIRQAPRTATVTANSDCELLELSRSFLEKEAKDLAVVTQALHDFTHERFLANLAATSPIFKPFPRSIRAEIIAKFTDLKIEPGHVVISEGDMGQGLYLIMKGHIDVTKNDGGTHHHLATLQEGDVFGEISLIEESPTTATCKAKTRGELLFLPAKVFRSTMARHPELKDTLAQMTAERLKKTEDAISGDDGFVLLEDDDLIML